MELLSLFCSRLNIEIKPEVSLDHAWRRAFAATYETAFGDDTADGRNDNSIAKNRAALDAFLSDHGYGSKTFQVNLKSVEK